MSFDAIMVNCSFRSRMRMSHNLSVGSSSDDGKDIALAHDEVLLAIEGDFGPRILAVENLVADFELHRDQFAVLGPAPGPGGDDFTDDRLFLRRIGKDDPSLGLLLCR